MANLVFTRSAGRFTEFTERVNANDPTNAVLVWMVLATSGLEADNTLRQKDSFSDLVSGTTNEVTNSGYSRSTFDQAGGLTVTYDDTNHRTDVDGPDITKTGVAAGDGWSRAVYGYDSDSTAGTDANILPSVLLDFVVTPDGSDITQQVGANGFYRAAT
jgi:NDP-sugar pyrophosphorylase family protein